MGHFKFSEYSKSLNKISQNQLLKSPVVIIAFLLTLFAVAVIIFANPIFEDDFETGDTSKWTSKFVESGNTLEVISSAAYGGSYGLHIKTTGSNDDDYLRKSISSTNEIYTRVMMKLVGDVSTGNHQIFQAAASSTDGGHIGSLAIRRTSSDQNNNFFTLASSSWVDTGFNFNLNEWYCVELHVVQGSSGRIRAWVDGSLVADRQNINTGSNPISWLRLGTDATIVTSDYYFDDFKYGSSQMGCAPQSDTTPPLRSNGSPTGSFPSGTTQATISLDTDEQATCRYSTTPGTSYDSMVNDFDATNSTSHSSLVTGLSDGNSYTYYVRCADASGNQNTNDFPISFDVAVPDTTSPIASVSINSGANVTTTTSVTLSLSCVDESGVKDVSYSNDGVFDTEPLETYATTKLWTFDNGDGEKTVWYQCRDNSTNMNSIVATDTIVLDTTAPSTSVASVEGDTASPFEDPIDDGDTDIVVNGETGMSCRWYDNDVDYTDSSGTSCLTSGSQATCVVAPTSTGLHTRYISCRDQSGNIQLASNNLDVIWNGTMVDAIPPVRSNGAPSGSLPSGTTHTTISLDTDESATCKYSTTFGTSYDSMQNTFSTTGGMSHSSLVTGLSDESTYNYYVRCMDANGNNNTDDFAITFSISGPSSFDVSKLKQTNILSYKYPSGDHSYSLEEPFEELYNFNITFFDENTSLTADYIAQFDVILHPMLNDLTATEESALIEWANQPGHILVGGHSSAPSRQDLMQAIFNANAVSTSSTSLDRNTVNEAYDLGTLIKYSKIGASTSSSVKLTNVGSNVIASLTSGAPCFVENNNHFYGCTPKMREVHKDYSPAQPALLSALGRMDIAMPKIKFFVVFDDTPQGFWRTVSGTNITSLELATSIVNYHGSVPALGINSKRFDSYPPAVTWIKNNRGTFDMLSHSWNHQSLTNMDYEQQTTDFDNFDIWMKNYNLNYEMFFTAPSDSANFNITPQVAAEHGFRYLRNSVTKALPYLYDWKDGVYVLPRVWHKYATTLPSILNDAMLNYHGFVGINMYSHYNDGYDNLTKADMMNQSYAILNSMEWSELGSVKDFFNMHRLLTNRFYRDGGIMYVESVGEFTDGGYVELLLPQTDATYCKIVNSNIYLLQCSGSEVYVPVPSNESSPIYIEVHNDTAPSNIAKLVSYDKGVFLSKAEYDQSTGVVSLYAHGFGKKVSISYPSNSFSATDNSTVFAVVNNGALTSSNSSYSVSYNPATGVISFEVPTLMTEAFVRELRLEPN